VLETIFSDTEDVLLSYGHLKRMDPRAVRPHLKLPSHVNLWIDSSGFQIGTKVTGKASVFDVYDFQNSCAQVAISLDVPGDISQTYRNAILGLTYSKGFEHSPQNYAVATCNGNIDSTIELVKKYATMDFDGIALGAVIPTGSVNLNQLALLLLAVRRITKKPIHALGVGGYDAFYLLAAAGVASFDSAKFLVGAKWRIYHLARGGMMYVGDHYNNYRKRPRQTSKGDLPCKCPVCVEVKRIEIFQEPRAECVALLALHNYYMMKNEVRLIELALSEGWFRNLLEDRARKSANLKRALRVSGLSQRSKMKKFDYLRLS
jgi:7-cyano-7-deazaguanine tRNA-ribosyltransferase